MGSENPACHDFQAYPPLHTRTVKTLLVLIISECFVYFLGGFEVTQIFDPDTCTSYSGPSFRCIPVPTLPLMS